MNSLRNALCGAAAVLILLATFSGGAFAAERKIINVGEVVEEVLVKDLDGNDTDILKQWQDKDKDKYKLLLVFFNTSCSLCMEELIFLEKMVREKKADKVSIAAIGIDIGGPAMIRKFLETRGYPFPVYSNQTFSVGLSFGLAATPASVVIERNGTVLSVIGGYAAGAKKTVNALFE